MSDALAPAVAEPSTPVRSYVDVAAVIGALIAANVIAHFTSAWASLAMVPVTAVALVIAMRLRGLGWVDLGLGRAHLGSGTRYALAAAAAVTALVALAALFPATRQFFLADRYVTLSGAVFASLVLIPLQTVIPEELAFRGVLHGTLAQVAGFRGVAAAGSLLFGLWHIGSSLGLTAGNAGLASIFGGGLAGQLLGVMGAVAATAAAGLVFTWLRHRSGSLLAPIALHWALNGAGALAAALVWKVSA